MARLFLALATLLLALTSVLGGNYQTDPPPVKCGSESFFCDEQTCRDGKCVCANDLHSGPGGLGCLPRGNAVCSVVNDPDGNTMSGEYVGVNSPCRLLLTHVKMDHKTSGEECEVEVFSSNDRYRKAKWAVGSIEVKLSIKLTNGEVVWRSYKASGTAEDGNYQYVRQARESTADGATYQDFRPAHAKDGYGNDLAVFEVNRDGATLRLNIARCGIRILFRVADKTYAKDQLKLPGVVLGVNERYFDVTYQTPKQTLCMKPDFLIGDNIHNGVEDISDKLLFNIYKEANYDMNSEFLGFTTADDNTCETLKETAQRPSVSVIDDDTANLAMSTCKFLLKPSFGRCFSEGTAYSDTAINQKIVQLYSICFDLIHVWESNDLRPKCEDAKGILVELEGAGCLQELPSSIYGPIQANGLQGFANLDCNADLQLLAIAFPDLAQQFAANPPF